MSQIILIYILAKREKKDKAALREGLNWDINLDVACPDVNSRTTPRSEKHPFNSESSFFLYSKVKRVYTKYNKLQLCERPRKLLFHWEDRNLGLTQVIL